MSTNKKFRVQNGLDVTGEVVVGGITVINADGTVVSDVSDQLVPLQADVSALETAVENIIGTSPETLDTLQEIVAAYEGADSDLQLLVAQTNQSVQDLETSVGAINDLEDKTNNMQAEINALSGADTSLTTSVAANAAAITANTTAISNEVTRATAAEQANTDAIVVEAAARAAADSDLSASISAISSSVNTGDLTVTGSATFESGINIGSNGGSIGYDDTSEDIQMMSDVDMSGNLIHNLGTPVASTDAASKSYVDGRIGDVIGGSVESLDTIKEVVDAFQNADSDIQSLITANSTSVSANTTAIAAETTRAQGVEASLQSQITASVSDTSDLDSDVQANAAAIAVNASNHSTLETFIKGPAPTVSLDTTATQVVPAINELVAAVADTSGITAAFQAADSDVTAAFQAADASLQAQIDAGAFDGSAIDQNLVPATTDTYSLGTPDKVWKDLYIGPGSLYLNGTKILEDNSGTITMYADAGQNLSFGATGGGSIDLNAGDESIQIKSDLVLSVGETISTVGGAATRFGGSVNMQTHKIENVGAPTADLDVATKLYVDTLIAAGTVSGDRTFDANVVVEGNLTVSGTTTTVNSETISLADNIIDLNSNLTSGAPTEHAGIRVLRGDESAVQVRWNETSDHWEVYNGSAWTKIALDTDDLAEGSTNLYFTEVRARGCVSADDNSCIDYNESTGKFSLDVAETEAAITPDSAKDADKLDGQHGSYYRINVYDANGALVN